MDIRALRGPAGASVCERCERPGPGHRPARSRALLPGRLVGADLAPAWGRCGKQRAASVRAALGVTRGDPGWAVLPAPACRPAEEGAVVGARALSGPRAVGARPAVGAAPSGDRRVRRGQGRPRQRVSPHERVGHRDTEQASRSLVPVSCAKRRPSGN